MFSEVPRRENRACTEPMKNRKPLAPMAAMALLTLLAPAAGAETAAPAETRKAPRRTLEQLAESKRTLAAELVRLTRVEQRLAAMAADSHAGLDAQLNQGLNGPAAQFRPIVEEYRVKLHAIVNEGFDWKSLQGDIVNAHADAYSEAELKELVAFFGSKVGKAYVENSEKLGASIGAITGARMETIRPRIQSTLYELDLRIRQAAQQQPQQPAPAK